MDLEEQLKAALRRKQPSADFASRVISSALAPRSTTVARRSARVAAALMLTALLGGWAVHEIAERRAGERARAEVLLALHIAGSKVRYAKTQVHGIGH
ncbi:MAG TPA: hypothetical protein VGK31_01610 [Thermoanaerobaculia bacterium]|jgi:hypothetical protein